MHELFSHLPALLKSSGQASVLIVLVLIVQWALGGRLNPRWRCALWLLVVLRLAWPWTIPSPLSLFNLLQLPSPRVEAIPEQVANLAPLVTGDHAQSSAALFASSEFPWLAWLWAGGVVLLGACAVFSHWKLHRRIAGRRPLVNADVLNLLEDCKAMVGVRTPIYVIETAATTSPALFGFIRPRLLLPSGMANSFSQEELRHIFLHEMAHVRRQDILAGWAMLVLQTLHWFNPLVWIAFRRLRVERELACDHLALSCTPPCEKESYGLTVLKLLEGLGRSVWVPGLAGIMENKEQMKERIKMIAKFHETERGLVLALALLAGLALVTLTDAQTPSPSASGASNDKEHWDLQQTAKLAEAGDDWAAYDLWDSYQRGKHGLTPDPAQAQKWAERLVQTLWVVRFEPVGDFAPTNPQEFLGRIHQYSRATSGRNKIGAASFFRTTMKDDKLVASFVSDHPEELKASLSKVPGVKVTGAEKLTVEAFVKYEASPQESLWSLQQKLQAADKGNQWAAYDLWDAYYRGHHGVNKDAAEAEKWLAKVTEKIWVVRFEPVDDFSPANALDFLNRISAHASCYSGKNDIGVASFFRTTKKGGKLMASFLSVHPDQLKAGLAKVPGIKVTSAEKIEPKDFVKYEESSQESL